MTINSEVRIAGPFSGNDVTVDFPFAFKVFDADEVLVVREEAGVELVLELSVDYTVALNADQEAAPGGAVTLLAGPLPSGETLTLTSALAPLQPVDLTNQGGFYPRVINNAFDRVTILLQQLGAQVARSVRFPLSDGTELQAELPTKAERANRYVIFDAAGNITTSAENVEQYSQSAAASAAAAAASAVDADEDAAAAEASADSAAASVNSLAALVDQVELIAAAIAPGTYNLSGTGAQTLFLLPIQVPDEDLIDVYIGGVYQQKSEYELVAAGTYLQFEDAPPAGVSNIELRIAANMTYTLPRVLDYGLISSAPDTFEDYGALA